MSASASSRSWPPEAYAPRAASRARDGSPMSTSSNERIFPLEVRPLGRILLGGEPVLADREPGLGIPGGDQDLVEEREHLRPHSGFPRHLEQRLANAWMFGVAGGHLGEETEGAGGIAQPEPSQLGDLNAEIGVEERRREPLLERPGQVGGAIELGGELLQLGCGGHVVRLPRQPVACDQEPFHRIDGGRRHRELQAGGKLGVGSRSARTDTSPSRSCAASKARAMRASRRADCSGAR